MANMYRLRNMSIVGRANSSKWCDIIFQKKWKKKKNILTVSAVYVKMQQQKNY